MGEFERLQEQFLVDEITESFIVPNTLRKEELAAVLKNGSELPNLLPVNDLWEERGMTKLLQLRYRMLDYLESPYYNPKINFGYFLGEYIDRLGIKRKAFAESIGLLPTELSQIINHHRRAKDKLAFRLEIHSKGCFPAILWFKLIQKDRQFELFHDDSWLEREKPFVKGLQ